MTLLYAIRYFVIVSVVPRLFLAGFIVAVAAAAIRVANDPAAAVESLTPVLLLQLFAASSGFQLPARRGHFDLLLTSGTPRWKIALAHCVVSITPGIVSWIIVGMFELVSSHGSQWTSFAAGTCAAFVGSSFVAWGTAVYSSRTGAAIGWLLVMTIAPVAHLISPLRLLGEPARDGQGIGIALVLASAVVALAAALRHIIRGNTPLEATQ